MTARLETMRKERDTLAEQVRHWRTAAEASQAEGSTATAELHRKLAAAEAARAEVEAEMETAVASAQEWEQHAAE